MLHPWKPASAISLMHCSKGTPMSMLGKSSFHHSVGVTPSLILVRSRETGAFTDGPPGWERSDGAGSGRERRRSVEDGADRAATATWPATRSSRRRAEAL